MIRRSRSLVKRATSVLVLRRTVTFKPSEADPEKIFRTATTTPPPPPRFETVVNPKSPLDPTGPKTSKARWALALAGLGVAAAAAVAYWTVRRREARVATAAETALVSGPTQLTAEAFAEHYVPSLLRAATSGGVTKLVLGCGPGVDQAVIDFFLSDGRAPDVDVEVWVCAKDVEHGNLARLLVGTLVDATDLNARMAPVLDRLATGTELDAAFFGIARQLLGGTKFTESGVQEQQKRALLARLDRLEQSQTSWARLLGRPRVHLRFFAGKYTARDEHLSLISHHTLGLALQADEDTGSLANVARQYAVHTLGLSHDKACELTRALQNRELKDARGQPVRSPEQRLLQAAPAIDAAKLTPDAVGALMAHVRGHAILPRPLLSAHPAPNMDPPTTTSPSPPPPPPRADAKGPSVSTFVPTPAATTTITTPVPPAPNSPSPSGPAHTD